MTEQEQEKLAMKARKLDHLGNVLWNAGRCDDARECWRRSSATAAQMEERAAQ